jgi:hypothetical protein
MKDDSGAILMKFAVLIFLIPATVAFGPVAPRPTSLRAGAAPTFACGQNTFGPGFAGANIETVITQVRASAQGQPKSEFETSGQYERRQGWNEESLVFVIPKETDGANVDQAIKAWVHYDADAGAMTVKASRAGHTMMSSNEPFMWLVGFDLVSHSRYGREYVGTNGFGAKTIVTEEKRTIYGLAFAPKDSRMVLQSTGELDPVKIAMMPEQARTLKPFLRMAMVVQTRPHVFETEDYHSATLDYPWETSTAGYYLDMSLEHLVVFDSRTGKILKMVPDCDAAEER